jgi:segregation and condensation protein B
MASVAKMRVVVSNEEPSEPHSVQPESAKAGVVADVQAEAVQSEAQPGEAEPAEASLAEAAHIAEARIDDTDTADIADIQAQDVQSDDFQEDEARTEPSTARPEEFRLLEALLFAASEPLDEKTLGKRLPEGTDVAAALAQLQAEYAMRGVNLVCVAGKWTFRTAGDLSWLLTREAIESKKLSRAAIETLAIVAYHQPVTRAEIEEIRGVSTSKGTLDVLLETGWVRLRGRRKAPGRPVTYGTNEAFLSHFGLEALGDLPGLEELKGSGLLDGRLPAGFQVPLPSDDPTLREDEDPLDAIDLDLGLAPPSSRAPEEE